MSDTFRPIETAPGYTVTPGTATNRHYGEAVMDFGITKNRKTHLFVDGSSYELVEQAYTLEREASQIAKNTPDFRQNSKFQLVDSEAGIKIANYWYDVSTLIERVEADDAWLNASNCIIPGAFEFVDEWRKPDTALMTGLATGQSANVATTGGKRLRKKVQAGATWINGIIDSFIFPTKYMGELTSDNVYAMDTCLISNDVDTAGKDLHIEYYTPSASGDGGQLMYSVVFVGPATGIKRGTSGIGSALAGRGVYCLNIFGRGKAELYEQLTDQTTWINRANFRFNTGGHDSVMTTIDIHKFVMNPTTTSCNGKIVFSFAQNQSNSVNADADHFGKTSSTRSLGVDGHAYFASADGPTRTPTHDTSIRVRMRQDLRGVIGIATALKPTAMATLQDDPFVLPFIPRAWAVPADRPYTQLLWKSSLPPGSTGVVDCKLYRYSNDAECTLVTGAGFTGSNFKTYYLNADENCYYVKIFMTADQLYSPLFQGYRIARAPGFIEVEYSGAEEEISMLRGVNITGAERNPSMTSANIMVSDTLNQHEILRSRGSIPIRVEVETAPDTDPTKRCILFRGYTKRVTAIRRRRGR